MKIRFSLVLVAMAYASPAVSDGIVVIGARDRQVHAIQLSDGKLGWVQRSDLRPADASERIRLQNLEGQ